ncbi:hypothetical protein G6F57_021397 [Rhizopus arrhizus]|nr:hypothetical protein G6F57_021397 [Rhizopus arrhizus]
MGLTRIKSGKIAFDGTDLTALPVHKRAAKPEPAVRSAGPVQGRDRRAHRHGAEGGAAACADAGPFRVRAVWRPGKDGGVCTRHHGRHPPPDAGRALPGPGPEAGARLHGSAGAAERAATRPMRGDHRVQREVAWRHS